MDLHIELTERERNSLRYLSERTGKSESQLVHDAVERLIADVPVNDWKAAFAAAEGMWKDRDDLIDLRQLRAECGRHG